MQQPTPAQARSFHAAQSAVAVAAVEKTKPMFVQRQPLPEIAATVAGYQIAAALIASAVVAKWSGGPVMTDPAVFGGWSSLGFPVVEPIIATIDHRVPAPPEAVPAPWWEDAAAFTDAVERLIYTEVADVARTASQTELTAHGWTSYVRILTPPSCKRCVVLAGRIYRWSTGFDRHPGDDCVMVPAHDNTAHELLTDPLEAIKAGHARDLTQAEYKAIVEDGADPTRVINAVAGMAAPGGYKATTTGTTRRSAWRRANPSKEFRLRPEGIYRWVEDKFSHLPQEKQREIALEQLRNNGYLTS